MAKAKNVWNLGNTTIRNPNRIERGLKLFAEEFQGNVHGADAEAGFWKRLGEEKIVDSVAGGFADLNGRKWRSVLVKLGFATDSGYKIGERRFLPEDLVKQYAELGLSGLKYEITPIGKTLLAANTTAAIQDVFLRQLLRHELPNPIETGFPAGHLKPFIYVLKILKELQDRGKDGLNKEELAIFVQLFVDLTEEQVRNVVDNILKYRGERAGVEGRNKKKAYDQGFLDNASQVGGVKPATLRDYADTTFRYSQMSGLLTTRGSRIILRNEKAQIIDAILSREPIFLAQTDPLAYLADFYKGTSLPTDDVPFAIKETNRLADQIRSFGVAPETDVAVIQRGAGIQVVENTRYLLAQQLGWLKEGRFAKEQEEEKAIREVIELLEAIENEGNSRKKGIFDRPTYLEWIVWRSFLAIDHISVPIHQTRRFPLDDDMNPRNPAPGGGADMIFEFDDFILVVEVTLTTSSRQLFAEGEPVRRHVADIKEKTDKDVYCVFIAPVIDNNIAETFRMGVWYSGDNEGLLNIVPFTIQQFKQIIQLLLSKRFLPKELQKMFDKCLVYRNTKAPDWKRKISEITNSWSQDTAIVS
jgi:hypothetical protein